ncbi:MAG: pyrroline-5-carboxylate reductase family protein [Akkermansia muciniphila]
MKTGIIGLGKMGGALLRGMLKAGAAVPEEVWVYDHHHENVQALQEEYPGVHEAASEADAADAVEVLILAVKPHGVLPLISSLSEGGRSFPLILCLSRIWKPGATAAARLAPRVAAGAPTWETA